MAHSSIHASVGTVGIFHWICSVPIGITICSLGIMGNILSIYIWEKVIRKKKLGNPSTAIYLISLGVCDILLLIFFILTEGISAADPSITASYTYGFLFSYIQFPLLYTFVVASIWLIVGITINRFVMTVCPARGKDILTRSRTYLGISIISIFSVIVSIPHWLKFNVKPAVNGTFEVRKTAFGMSKGYREYESWGLCIVVVLVPWIIIAVLNTLIVKKLKEHSIKVTFVRQRAKKEKQDRNLTAMLLCVTFSFLVLIACQCVTQFLYHKEYKKNVDGNVWFRVERAFEFGKLGVLINSSINTIFYGLFGTTFRKQLRESFPCLYMKKRSNVVDVIAVANMKGNVRAEEDLALDREEEGLGHIEMY